MTATVETVLATARSQLGYVEGPPPRHDGNITKYWAELCPSLQGAPWCACFVRWTNIHAGGPDLPISNPYYCPNIVTYAKQHGLWNDSGHYSPGDIILFCWDGSGVAEHVGRVVSDNGSVVTTIEGNAQNDDHGDQSNGGGVYQRERAHNSTILGVLSYDKLLAHAAANNGAAPRNPIKGNPYAKSAADCRQGDKGDQVRFVQWAVGVPVDGVFGKTTLTAVVHFQAYHKLHVDGVVGVQTLGALRSVTH
jgi:peptidoglycan hydrolase-like protein with peptidoglycan-binding domain